MEVFAQFLARELAPLADYLNVPAAALVIAVLLAVGLLGHIIITRLVGKLQQSAERSVMRWDNVFTDALMRPSKWAIWLLVVYLSLGLFEGAEQFRTAARQAADTALILILAWIAQRALKGAEAELLSEHRGQRQSDDRATIRATLRLVRISLGIVVLLMVLQSLGVSVSGLLAFGGIGGLSIYLDRPFTVGDWIRSPDREIEGTVEDIGWRMTRIRTFDQRPLYIPNSIFSSVAVENPSRMNNRRIYETMGIRYDDVGVMEKIVANVKAMLESHEAIDLNRTLMVNFVTCGPSSLDFFIYTFTKTTDWATFHAIKQDILLRVLAIIADEGAEVAFPTRTLLLESEPDATAADPQQPSS